MYGDNKSVVTSSTIPHSSLNKRQNMLSYHQVQEQLQQKCMDCIGVTQLETKVISQVNTGITKKSIILSKSCLIIKDL